MGPRVGLLAVLALGSCAGSDRVTVIVTPEDEAAVQAFVDAMQDERVTVSVAQDPLLEQRAGGLTVAVLGDASCDDCYTLTGTRRDVVVSGGGVLGRQYGLADVFEQLGYRFHHPLDTYRPESYARVDPDAMGVLHEPDSARRGIHMHTLHPIEGLYDFWMPSEEDAAARAGRVVDWVVKNRGNHLQWVSLDDIMDDSVRDDWKAHTREIHDIAHERGITVGVGVQLFGSGNLQQAFDLLDTVGTEEQQRAEVAERAEILLGDLDWDLVNLSFGEFFGEDPDTFIASTDLAIEEMARVAPNAEFASVIHVGDDLRLTYQGEEIIYYFLAVYADERLVPWVHTVQYFNLFDPALGTYHHEDFAMHRELLLDRMQAGEPVGYFPESAYWIAFDNPVPSFLPIYVESRHRDMREVRAATGRLPDQHVLFSSGWEWGYWQTDVATLRMSYEMTETPGELYEHMFAPWKEGAALSALLTETSDVQHQWLIGEGLSAYLAGVDVIMEVGYDRGIVSQPVRELVPDVARYDEPERAAFAPTVDALDGMATALEGLSDRAMALDPTDRWVREVVDGMRINALRARFIERIYAGITADDPAPALDEAEALIEQARVIVDARHSDFHDPQADRLLEEGANPTLYQYGYLIRAEELCFWHRDLAQARNSAMGDSETVPACF